MEPWHFSNLLLRHKPHDRQMASFDSGPPTTFIVFAVIVGVIIVVAIISGIVRSCSPDKVAAPPPVQIVSGPRPDNMYPHHAIDVADGYVPMATTPRFNTTLVPQAVLVPTAPTATTQDREVLAQALQPLSSPTFFTQPPLTPTSAAAAIPASEDPLIVTTRLPFDAVAITILISTGGFGRIYKGTCRGETVAVKKLLPETRRDLKRIAEFFEEIKLMAMLEHEHIVRYIGVAWDALSEVGAVIEYMEGGDLRTMLTRFEEEDHRPHGFDEQKALLALHIAHALTYMHSRQPVVLHRDLKSKNILLDASQCVAKLTDFGVSRERGTDTMTAAIGTVLWMAPEVMAGDRYDDKADMFSFGIVLSELDTHMMPYADVKARLVRENGRPMPDTALLQRIMTGQVNVTFSPSLHPSVRQLAESCVSLDPSKRPTAAQALYQLQQIVRDT